MKSYKYDDTDTINTIRKVIETYPFDQLSTHLIEIIFDLTNAKHDDFKINSNNIIKEIVTDNDSINISAEWIDWLIGKYSMYEVLHMDCDCIVSHKTRNDTFTKETLVTNLFKNTEVNSVNIARMLKLFENCDMEVVHSCIVEEYGRISNYKLPWEYKIRMMEWIIELCSINILDINSKIWFENDFTEQSLASDIILHQNILASHHPKYLDFFKLILDNLKNSSQELEDLFEDYFEEICCYGNSDLMKILFTNKSFSFIKEYIRSPPDYGVQYLSKVIDDINGAENEEGPEFQDLLSIINFFLELGIDPKGSENYDIFKDVEDFSEEFVPTTLKEQIIRVLLNGHTAYVLNNDATTCFEYNMQQKYAKLYTISIDGITVKKGYPKIVKDDGGKIISIDFMTKCMQLIFPPQ